MFLPEESGGSLVETSNFLANAGDLALQRHFVSLGGDGAVLQAGVSSSGGSGLVLHGGQVLGGVVLLQGHGLLGVLQVRGEFGAFGGDGLLQVGQRFGAFRVTVLDGLDLVGDAARNHALFLNSLFGGSQFRFEVFVDSLDGSSGSDLLVKGLLEFVESFGHHAASFLLFLLLADLGSLRHDQHVELVPGPVLAFVVVSDVVLDGGNALLLGGLGLEGDGDQAASDMSLHLVDDDGESSLTDLLKLGQTTSAEHDLGVSGSEVIGVHANGGQSLVGAAFGVSGHLGEDFGRDDGITSHEIGVWHLVGQTQHANTDTFQHSVAVKLVHDKRSVNVSRLLDFVGNDATHEVRVSRVQGSHQLEKGLSVGSGNGGHGGALLLLSGLLENEGDDGVGGALHHADDGVVDGILVLEEPASDVVADGTGVVVKGEVSLGHALLGRFGLGEGVVLAQMLVHHLLQVGHVSGLGNDTLFLQHGQDAHFLLNQLDGLNQVHTKVDESPLDALGLVLFLLLDEHVVVEELLQTLICVVNEELLQDVEVENLETGDVQHTDEVFSGVGSIERIVDFGDDPVKETGEERLGSGRNGESNLVNVLALLHVVLTDLQLGLHEGVDEEVGFDSDQRSAGSDFVHAFGLSLLLTTLLFPFGVAQVGDGDGALVTVILLRLTEAQSVKGGVGGAHFLGVIHAGHGQHTLTDEVESAGIGLGGQTAHGMVFGISVGHDLVEDVVISLDLQLEGDTGLFQKVGLDIGGGDLHVGAELDTDELTESGGVVVTDGFGVTIGLQGRIGLNNLFLEGTGVGGGGGLGLGGVGIGAVQSVVLQHFLCVLSLASARLTGNQRRLILVLHLQELEGAVSDSVQVRWGFIPSLVAVKVSHDGSVHEQPFVRVDTDAEETRVGVNLKHLVTGSQIVQHAGFVQNGQVGHVLLLFEFRRITLKDLGLWQILYLGFGRFNFDGLSIVRLDSGSDVDFLGVGNPSRGLGIKGGAALLEELIHGALKPQPIGMGGSQTFLCHLYLFLFDPGGNWMEIDLILKRPQTGRTLEPGKRLARKCAV